MNYVGGPETAGDKLKATEGWKDFNGLPSGNGTDEFGFSALPGGYGGSEDGFVFGFVYVGIIGEWWSASEGGEGSNYAYSREMAYLGGKFWSQTSFSKSVLFSVRCLKD